MSMLSAQCDELRKEADRLDRIAKVSTSKSFNSFAPMLRDAADTIWSLRNRCVDLRSENAKLRELVHDALLAINNSCLWYYFEPYSFWTDWTNRACELEIEE